MKRSTIALAIALATSACASAPPAPAIVSTSPPPPGFEQKMSWILGLEDLRIMRRELPVAAAVTPPAPARPGAAVVTPIAPPRPDLARLIEDSEGRIRRRAALAIGRVGLREGVAPLVRLLSDPELEVRQMAAFALGLIGDASAHDALVNALHDPAPAVKASAAEALGLIGDTRSAEPIAQMARAIVDAGGLAPLPAEMLDAARDTPAAAVRLAIYALVRLKAYDALASVVLDGAGQPRLRWWPVAYALQRIEDPRALAALLTLLDDPNPYTRAFAAKGLGAIPHPSAAAALRPLLETVDETVAVEAIRALAKLGDAATGPRLMALIRGERTSATIRLEAVAALGKVGGAGATDLLIALLGDRNPSLRAAATRAFAEIDSEGFITVLSGLDDDREWRVRVALAGVLSTLRPERGLPRLRTMLQDPEPRVIPAVLAALTKLAPPDAATIMLERLKDADPVIRAAAAQAIGELKPERGGAALAEAYDRGAGDDMYAARTAALSALVAYGATEATPVLTRALADKEWAVRVRAAALLKPLDPSSDVALRIRPVPRQPRSYEAAALVNPPFSSEASIETDRGTIRIELAVTDAPLTVENFVMLARQGFFENLPIHRVVPDFVIQGGDPRGDGEGGPRHTIRDELNQRPFLRGVVGMALDWADTGGSQFFITHSPQPHLDAKYTVFGRVLSGMDVVDAIQPWDVIRKVTIWDGQAAN